MEYGIRIFGGKWDARVISTLNEYGRSRYHFLRGHLKDISDTALAGTLRKLVEEDIIVRIDFDEAAPHVEYELSEKGRSLIPIIRSICRWSYAYYKDEINKQEMMTQCEHCRYLKGE